MKKIIIIILFLSLAGCSSQPACDNLGADITDTETQKLHDFERLYKEAEEKYKHVKKYEKDNSKYLVNEFEDPKGNIGYWIVKEGDGYVESVCIGVESECKNKNYKNEIVASSTLEK